MIVGDERGRASVALDIGTIQTVVGTGEGGYAGDGGPAIQALIGEAYGCDFDTAGNLYISDGRNYTIRRIDRDTGIITTVAGCGLQGYSGDEGPATEATLDNLYSLQVDTNGDIYIVDRLNAAIRKVDAATGMITTVAGTGEPGYSGDGGPGPKAQLREPNDCFLDGRGGLFIADIQEQRVRRLDLKTGIITTFAGDGQKRRSGDGLPATQASLMGPRAVCMDRQGNTYICEREGNGVRKVDVNGMMSTFAGTGEPGYSGDGGPALEATWGAPKAIRCDHQDNVIVVDTENHAIRRIDAATGIVTTIAGGRQGGGGDGGPATAAGLERPHGCGIDPQGTLYIADGINHRVRCVRLGEGRYACHA
jgi:sugar lactone lactonase YvrE